MNNNRVAFARCGVSGLCQGAWTCRQDFYGVFSKIPPGHLAVPSMSPEGADHRGRFSHASPNKDPARVSDMKWIIKKRTASSCRNAASIRTGARGLNPYLRPAAVGALLIITDDFSD
jgi:hypothetical protein